MKVFISWSGERSKSLAQVLRDWLPRMLHAVRPYFSPDDVAKGSRWTNEIAVELHDSGFGILCLTPDNFAAPWMVFEAGALSKNLDQGRVCPLMFGFEPRAALTGPLSQFQAAQFGKTEIARLVRALNYELGDHGLQAEVLADVFEVWWPRLEAEVKAIQEQGIVVVDRPEPLDVLEEILSLTRGIANAVGSGRGTLSVPENPPSDTIGELLVACDILCVHAEGSTNPESRITALRLLRPLGGLLISIGASQAANEVAGLLEKLLEFVRRDELAAGQPINSNPGETQQPSQ